MTTKERLEGLAKEMSNGLYATPEKGEAYETALAFINTIQGQGDKGAAITALHMLMNALSKELADIAAKSEEAPKPLANEEWMRWEAENGTNGKYADQLLGDLMQGLRQQYPSAGYIREKADTLARLAENGADGLRAEHLRQKQEANGATEQEEPAT